ncbi:hypothetical protein Tco_1484375 [Tanacetum coccineum]
MRHFSRECRAPRSKDNRNWNQCSSTKTVKIEDASKKAMCAIDGASFDWENMAEDEIQEIWLSCFLSSEYDDLLVKLSDTDFKAATYKRGLATLEVQIVKYKEHEVLFSEEIALLKRSVGCKEYELGLLRTELEKVKQENEGVGFKIAKFDKYAKDLNEMLESQITDKSKKGIGYNAVPSPHPLILNRPTTLDLSYSGLDEFKEPEVNEYGPRDSSLKNTTGCDKESDNSEENTDDSLEQHQMTDTETSSFETPLSAHKHMAPRAVLMKTGLKSFNTARLVNTVRSINTGRPFSTARPFRSTVNTVRARGFNVVKPSACWVWRPSNPNGAIMVFKKYNYIDAQEQIHNNMPPRRSSTTARAATATARVAAAAVVAATPITAAAVEQLIEARVSAALANHETLRNSTNVQGDGSHNSDTRIRGTVHTPRECTYKDFLNCKPLSFKGTEGVVVLSQCVSLNFI